VFHADRDTTVHRRNGEQVPAQAGAAAEATGGPRATVERGRVPGGRAYSPTMYVDLGGRALLERWVVHGGGHAGSYADPRGPDASKEKLRFFLGHRHLSPRP
jgi:hypothetical protein